MLLPAILSSFSPALRTRSCSTGGTRAAILCQRLVDEVIFVRYKDVKPSQDWRRRQARPRRLWQSSDRQVVEGLTLS